MRTRGYIWLVLSVLSTLYRLYEDDMTGAVLSLALIPMCFILINKPDEE
jgi:hypothetical protein